MLFTYILTFTRDNYLSSLFFQLEGAAAFPGMAALPESDSEVSVEVSRVPALICSVKCSSSGVDKMLAGIEAVTREQPQPLDDDQDFDSTDPEESLFSNKVKTLAIDTYH